MPTMHWRRSKVGQALAQTSLAPKQATANESVQELVRKRRYCRRFCISSRSGVDSNVGLGVGSDGAMHLELGFGVGSSFSFEVGSRVKS